MINRVMSVIAPPIFNRALQKIALSVKRPIVKMRLMGFDRLHLACGLKTLEGWANIDLRGSVKIIGWDLCETLPVRDDSIKYIFCEHFIEHITYEEARALLVDCRRVMQSGGILRLSTPNLDKLLSEYTSNRTSEWHDVNWYPTTPCRMINEGFRLWGHQFVYNDSELKSLLLEAGFRQVIQVSWRDSETPELKNLESRPFHGEIICEAIK